MDDNRKISIEEAKEEVELAGRRIGLLHLAYAETLVEELGEKDDFSSDTDDWSQVDENLL